MPNSQDPIGKPPPAFGVRFCRIYNCNEIGFQRRLFWRCLNRRSVPPALIVAFFSPSSFHAERVLIKDLWRVRDMEGVREAIRYYQGLLGSRSSPWGMRISAKRLIRLAEKVFAR